jgi:thiamine pyrophosphokinase
MDERQKIASIICGAPCERLDTQAVKGLVIAADRGLDAALAHGITPDIAVGDFDSARRTVPETTECIRVSPIKDDTDTILAAETAISRGCTELNFFCALGGRLCHTYANIQMLKNLLGRGIKATLFGDNEKVYLLNSDSGRVKIPRYDGYLSVFAYGDSAVVSGSGLKYPLAETHFSDNYPLGVSNEITEEFAEIVVQSGTALIIEHRGSD